MRENDGFFSISFIFYVCNDKFLKNINTIARLIKVYNTLGKREGKKKKKYIYIYII